LFYDYRTFLSIGTGNETRWDGEPQARMNCDWLTEPADAAWGVLSSGQRLAQEHIGWEFLALTT